jgi:hypothetical protein
MFRGPHKCDRKKILLERGESLVKYSTASSISARGDGGQLQGMVQQCYFNE